MLSLTQIIIFALVTAALGYYLGRRKTQTPILTAVIGLFCGMLPPLALIFLMVLVLKNDIPKQENS